MRIFAWIVGIFVGFMLAAGSLFIFDGRYDTNWLLARLGNLDRGVYALQVKVVDPWGQTQLEGGGTAFAYQGKLITANHVVAHHYEVISYKGTIEIYFELPDGTRVDCKPIFNDEPRDIAVLEPVDYILPNSLTLGDSSELFPGQLLICMGNTFGGGLSLKSSMLARVSILESWSSMHGMMTTGRYNDDDIAMGWNLANHGDSGGPVFVFRDGKPEVIGVLKFGQNGMEGFHKINSVLDIIGHLFDVEGSQCLYLSWL